MGKVRSWTWPNIFPCTGFDSTPSCMFKVSEKLEHLWWKWLFPLRATFHTPCQEMISIEAAQYWYERILRVKEELLTVQIHLTLGCFLASMVGDHLFKSQLKVKKKAHCSSELCTVIKCSSIPLRESPLTYHVTVPARNIEPSHKLKLMANSHINEGSEETATNDGS